MGVGGIFRRITVGIEGVEWKAFTSATNCKYLIEALLAENPVRRLPCQLGGITKLKQHAWDEDCDWEALAKQHAEPPHKPPKFAKRDISDLILTTDTDRPPQIEY